MRAPSSAKSRDARRRASGSSLASVNRRISFTSLEPRRVPVSRSNGATTEADDSTQTRFLFASWQTRNPVSNSFSRPASTSDTRRAGGIRKCGDSSSPSGMESTSSIYKRRCDRSSSRRRSRARSSCAATMCCSCARSRSWPGSFVPRPSARARCSSPSAGWVACSRTLLP